jgi:hypothetical protein
MVQGIKKSGVSFLHDRHGFFVSVGFILLPKCHEVAIGESRSQSGFGQLCKDCAAQ